MTDASQSNCQLDVGEIAAYVEGKLGPTRRSRLHKHLAECPDCRAEMVRVTRMLRTPRLRRSRVVFGLAAAAIAGLLLLNVLGPSQSDESRLLRDAVSRTDRPAPIVALVPAEGTVVRLDSLRFMWRSREEGAFYSLTLSNARGDVIWQTTTTDTVLELPSFTPIRPGQHYFWYVDGLLDGAVTTSTGMIEFEVAR